ncbi:MAG: glycosyltransferase [Spirochaetes bacterium]|nr:glycosyltransferase [Spirochaetota bacterium]MBL7005934.1 glycosyltransferase [Spirochaetia bacterium]
MNPIKDPPLHIAIFTDSFLPMISGVVTAVLNLAENLVDRGHSVLIVTAASKKNRTYSYKGIRVEYIASIPARFYKDFKWSSPYSLRIREICRKENIELIHFATPFFVSFVGINVARTLGIPVIGTFHTFISDPSNYRHFIRGKFFAVKEESVWQYSNLYYNAADLNTAPAQSTKHEMLRNGSTADIKVISNGIDPAIFDNSKAEQFKKRYALTGKTILYFGRISQDKNIKILLKCFFIIHRKLPEAKLLIVGDGPQLKELRDFAKSDPAGSHIIFTGGIPHDTLVKSGLFGACELFATSSLTENQPMTMLEAQANGIPCVGFNVRGIPDLIIDGVNGRILPKNDYSSMADAVLEILNDADLYQKYIDGTKQEIRRHLMSAVTDEWELTYRNLIDSYARGDSPRKNRLHLTQILAMLKEIKINLQTSPSDDSQG